MVKFEKIRYKNILSTGDYFQEYDFTDKALTLVIGKNGAGKTTLIDALFFALYGEAFRNVVKKKLLNSVNKKALLVELFFSVGPNSYLIRRGIKPDIFEFYINDVLVPMDAKKVDYQLNVNSAVRIDKKSLTSQVVLASRSYVPFMRLSAAERRVVIQDLLDIQVFTHMSKIAKTYIDGLKDELNVLDKNLREMAYKISIERSNVTVKSDTIKESVASFEQMNIVTLGEIEHLEGDITTLLDQCSDLSTLIEENNAISSKITVGKTRIDRLQDDWKKLVAEKKFYNNNDSCPTCRQPIDEQFKCTAVEELTGKQDVIKDEGVTLKSKVEELTTRQTELELLIRELRIKQNKASTKRGEVDAKRKLIETNKVQIKKLLTPTPSEEITESKINEYQTKYNEIAQQKAAKSTELDVVRVCSTMLKDDGIKTTIISKYLPTINATINKYIRMLGFNATFEMNETFEEKITDPYGEVFSYHSYSEGEKMRFDLAILFTWREVAKIRNTTDTNLLVLDEVLDASLDTEGAEDFMKVISEIVKNTNTIVISHKSEQIKDRFHKVVEFKKVKKFSQMKVVK